VLDLADVVKEAELRHGAMLDLCRRSTYNPTAGKWFGFCDNFVPDPGNYAGGGEWFCDGPCPERDIPLDYTLWWNMEGGIEQDYERSLSIADATSDDAAILAGDST